MEWLIDSGAPWWIIVIFLALGIGLPASASQKAATIPGMLGAGARWWQGRKQRRRDEAIADATAAAELTASERVADKEIERLDKRYDELAEDCAEDARRAAEAQERLEARVDSLENTVTKTAKQFFDLLGFHRLTVADLRKLDPEWSRTPPESLTKYL